jgi:acyl-coenzyme A synthetase/AMP-(fatty) acid ligase
MGAPIPRALVRAARAKVPGLVMIGGWGQTEEGLVTLGVPDDHDEKLIDTDGYPFPGMRIRVVDDLGEPLPAEWEGRVEVTGPSILALTAALELQIRGARRALTTMCTGVGQGISVLLEAA